MKLIDVTVSRLIPGPAANVFDVWLDPSCPGSPWHGAKKIIVSPVVDGLFFWGHQHANRMLPHYGRFLRVERGKLLEHTWMSESTHGLESTVSISFEARAGGTQVTILHRGLPDDDAGRGHEEGWEYFLGELEKPFHDKAKAR
jgi:uncharacterized protein YndB with AHSA1/START domain